MGVTIGRRKLKEGKTSLFLDLKCGGERRKEGLNIVLHPGSCNHSAKTNILARTQ